MSPQRPAQQVVEENINTTKLGRSCELYETLEKEAPSWLEFVDEYAHRFKKEILEVEPATKGAKRAIRRVLAEMLHDVIDAAVDDLNKAFRFPKRHSSTSTLGSVSTDTSSSSRDPIQDEPLVDDNSVMGEMSDADDEHANTTESVLRMKVLEQMVKEEMEELAEGMRDAIDDTLQ